MPTILSKLLFTNIDIEVVRDLVMMKRDSAKEKGGRNFWALLGVDEGTHFGRELLVICFIEKNVHWLNNASTIYY